MDIKTSIENKAGRAAGHRRWLAGAALLAVAGIAFLSLDTTPVVQANTLQLSQVTRGALDIKIKGYGKLKPRAQRFLTSRSQASVEAIYHRPGAEVSADTVILSLSNPTLDRDLASARLDLARQKAVFAELQLSQQSEQLARRSQLTLLNSELETARLRMEAESQLVDQGIVSALDFKRSRLSVSQLEQRVDIEQTRLSQLSQIQAQRRKVQEELLKQFELGYQSAREEYDKLQVRAGIDGILQSLEVEPGQTVAPGSQLALVGASKELKAELRVQQREAEQIAPGMTGVINTFSGTIQGRVVRIDPVVVEGRVLVELDLSGPLPRNARPELNIEGFIQSDTLYNVLLAKAPAGVRPFSRSTVFAMDPERKLARPREIEFGTMSDDRIQILGGIELGESLIVTDLSQWQGVDALKIQQETL